MIIFRHFDKISSNIFHIICQNLIRQFLKVTFNEIFCKLALFLFNGTPAYYIASGNSCWLLWPKCWLETEFDCRFELRFSLRINWIIATVQSESSQSKTKTQYLFQFGFILKKVWFYLHQIYCVLSFGQYLKSFMTYFDSCLIIFKFDRRRRFRAWLRCLHSFGFEEQQEIVGEWVIKIYFCWSSQNRLTCFYQTLWVRRLDIRYLESITLCYD